jgi:hypothetical protein
MRTDSIPMPPDPSSVTAADNPTAPAAGERGEPAATLAAADSARCWLCMGLGGIAIHIKWTEARGGGKPLWTAHEYPSDDPHPTLPCPVCADPDPVRQAAREVLATWREKFVDAEESDLEAVVEALTRLEEVLDGENAAGSRTPQGRAAGSGG